MATNLPIYKHAPNEHTFQDGLEFQDFVLNTLAKRFGWVIQVNSSAAYQFGEGESVQGFEFKLDNWCTKSHRLSIEVAEKSSRDVLNWTDSGIFRDDNTIFYVQGNREAFWIFFKHQLLSWYRKHNPEILEKYGTFKGFYMLEKTANILGFRIDCA